MCNKLCSSIWEPADHSGTTGKLREALVCHINKRFESARSLYEDVLSELSSNSQLTPVVQTWLKVAIDCRPLSARVRTDIIQHFTKLRGISPISTSTLSPAAVGKLAEKLSADAARKGELARKRAAAAHQPRHLRAVVNS